MIEPSVGMNPVMPGWPGFISAYPNGWLSLITAPTTEPVTVAEMKKQLRLDTAEGEPAPTAATVALAGAGAGNCDNGVWRVGITFVTATGETELGLLSATVTVADKTVNGKIAVSAIPLGGSLVTARNVYAIPPSGSVALYVAQLANNTATTYTLNTAAVSLGVQAPAVNTTSDPQIVELITTTRMVMENDLERALATQTVTLFLDAFPWWRAPIALPRPPAQSVSHVKYYDADGVLQTWAADQYLTTIPAGPTAQQAQIVPAAGVSYPLLPSSALTQRRPDAVQVTYVCGYASVAAIPAPIKSAMKILGGSLWFTREMSAVERQTLDLLLAEYRVRVY